MPDTMAREVTIELCRVADIRDAPNFAALAEEYAAESAIRELPWPRVDWPTYQMLEDAGALYVFGVWYHDVTAREGAELIGFVVLVTAMSAEYGVPLCCTEAFFVARAWRHTAAGLKLLTAALAKARGLGARGLAVNAPLGGKLAELLPKCGFREVGRMFFRSCSDG